MLYTPGSRPRALAKARQAGADALILDLEDAVAPAAKDEARDNVRAAVAEWGGCLPGGGCLVTVRGTLGQGRQSRYLELGLPLFGGGH